MKLNFPFRIISTDKKIPVAKWEIISTFNFPVQAVHKSELEELNKLRINDLTAQDERHEQELRECQQNFKDKLDQLDAKWQERLLATLEEKQEDMKKVEHEFQQREEQWTESKKSLEDKINYLQSEVKVKEAEVFSKVKSKGDARLTSAYNKLEAVEAEVESLKTVLG